MGLQGIISAFNSSFIFHQSILGFSSLWHFLWLDLPAVGRDRIIELLHGAVRLFVWMTYMWQLPLGLPFLSLSLFFADLPGMDLSELEIGFIGYQEPSFLFSREKKHEELHGQHKSADHEYSRRDIKEKNILSQ